jgi:dephospho-CoA kinase
MFKTKDSLLIEADKLAHDSLKAGTPVYKKIVSYFGSRILKGRRIDRGKLARIVFVNKAAMARLNGITHKQVIADIRRLTRQAGKRLVLLDAALLVEAGLRGMVDKLAVVRASREQRIERSRKRLGLSREEILVRMEHQISQGAKLRLADFIIDNSGSINETKKQVFEIRRKLWKS